MPVSLSTGVRCHQGVHGVHFDDLDAYKILHDSRSLPLFERTTGAFWQRLGWGGTLALDENPDSTHLVRAHHIEHHPPVTGVTEARARSWAERLTFGSRVMPMDEDLDFATGSRALMRVERETTRPASRTPASRARLSPCVRPRAARPTSPAT